MCPFKQCSCNFLTQADAQSQKSGEASDRKVEGRQMLEGVSVE